MNRMWNCIGFGLCALDYLTVVEKYPKINQKVDSVEYSQQGGGPVATAMVTLGRLGGTNIAFAGKIGDDREGEYIRKSMEQDGVNTSYLKVEPNTPSAQAFVWVEKKTGKRSVVLHREPRLQYKAEEIRPDPFENSKYLLIDGRDTDSALKAAQITRSCGGKVVMDAGHVRPRMDEFFRLVDYFICSGDFLLSYYKGLSVDRVMKNIHKMGCKWVVATLGDQGSIGFDGSQFFNEPAVSVPVVDTTGAGDVFHGAFLFGLLKEWNLPQIMFFANVASALKCRKLGGRAGIPDLEKMKKFVKSELKLNKNYKNWIRTW